MATPETRAYRDPMTNEGLTGHAVAAVCGLMAAATLVPTDTGTGWVAALIGTLGALAVVALNATAIAVRAHTHHDRWALANGGLVAVTFVGSLLSIDSGRDLRLDPTPTLWAQLFVALLCGSVLVAKDRAQRP